ncbi:MAG: alpha-hydroxy-acid oxidizing protein, partial [Nitrososphaerales archaeon]
VIVKEVGAGISKEVAIKLELAGVSAINIAGAGGTSWAGVEQIRGEAEGNKVKSRLGLLYWDWGIPTAVSLIEVRKAVKIPIIASGGLRNGLDIAKCMVLGADLCGMALPMLKYAVKSLDDLIEFIQNTILELKVAMYLVGAGNLKALRNVRYVITSPLTEWLKS